MGKVYQKIFEALKPVELDELHNGFAKTHNVKAAQFRPFVVGNSVVYSECVWYEEADESNGQIQIQPASKYQKDSGNEKKIWKVCNKCGKFVLVSKYKACRCGSTDFSSPQEPIKEEQVV